MYSSFDAALGAAAPHLASLPHALLHHARTRPQAKAFSHLGADGSVTALTYAELQRRVWQRARMLRERYPTQSRVMLALQGDLDFVVEFLAVVCAGHVAVPVYPADERSNAQALSRMTRISRDCSPSAIVTRDGRLRDLLDASIEVIAAHEFAGDTPADESGDALLPDEPQALALLQYTSGSTGDPKGVMITRAALAANSRLLSSALGLSPDSCGVGWLPLYHDMGLIGHVVHPVFVGMHSVLMDTSAFLARPLTWLETISRYQAHISSAPDFAYRLCAQLSEPRIERAPLDLGSWRLALNGSEPVRQRTMAEFARKFAAKGFRASAFFPCYGLAESTLFVSGGHLAADAASADADRLRSVCGPAAPGVQIEIVDAQSGAALPPGSSGEIWVRSPSNGLGYWGRPTLSQSTFGARLAGEGDGAAPFLRTGDLGQMIEGQLEVIGRLKNIIIIRGRNLHAEDLEDHLSSAVDGLRLGRLCAVGVQHGGAEHLAIVAETTQASSLEKLERDIRRHTFEYAAVQPLWVAFVAPKSIPRTSSGKLRRQRCSELLAAGQLPLLRDFRQRDAGVAEEPTHWLEEVCSAACQEAVGHATPVSIGADFFADLGMDSLSAVVLADSVSQQTGVRIGAGDIYRFANVRSLALRVQELIDAPNAGGVSAWDPEAGLDFQAESEPGALLRDTIAACAQLPAKQAASHRAAFAEGGTIVLTGATGFLGPHLLDQLLRQTAAKVVCIVRAPDDAAATARLQADFMKYGLALDLFGTRVECIAGDIRQESLGLVDDRYDALAQRADLVFNNAAEVNFLMPYSRLKASNVDGVRHLLLFCLRGKVKHLCHTSTQGIYEAHGPDTFYAEDAPLTDEVVRVAKGYARTKLVAEHLLHRIRELGFRASILRVGMVSGDSQHGIANGDPLISSLLLGCAQCGAVPQGDVSLDMSPVDAVARAMVAVAKDPQAANGNFNVSRRGGVSTREITVMLREAGVDVEVLAFAQWRARVMQQGADNALDRYKWILKDLTHVPPRAFFGTDKAEAVLSAAGVPAPDIDSAVVSRYISFYRGQGRYPVAEEQG